MFDIKDIRGRVIKDSEGFGNYSNVSIEEMDWLLEQAVKLQKLADTWIEIETEGTVEDADNFYSYFQDIMTEDY